MTDANSAMQLGLFAGAHEARRSQRGGAAPLFAGKRSANEDDRLRLCVLGSGSGGNCTIVRHGEGAILIDVGLGPRTVARRLAQAKASLDEVRAVCLTHLDHDHFRKSWPGHLLERGIVVHVHRWHVSELLAMPGGRDLEATGLVRTFGDEAFEVLPGLSVSTRRLQHDRQGTIGYRFTAGALSIGYATDLGHAPAGLIKHFAGVDLLCLESNYDHHMTIHSSRPTFVNRRNLSDSGHLSNEQAFEAVRAIVAASPAGRPAHIVLMHRSSQCNHPMKVTRTFAADARLRERITLAEQRRRTRWFEVKPLSPAKRAQAHWGF